MLELVEPLWSVDEPTVFELDLRNVEFVTPCALGILRVSLESAIAAGRTAPGCRLVHPASPDIDAYMRRMDVFAGLVNYSSPEPFRRHDPVRFAPMVTFEGEQGAADAARELVRSIGLGYSARVNAHLRSAMVEFAENVPLHSGVGSGVAGAQGWTGLGEVEVALADAGIGISESLRQNTRYADLSDEEALRRALDVRVSGLADDRRGQASGSSRRP